jgi:hypothetical protein
MRDVLLGLIAVNLTLISFRLSEIRDNTRYLNVVLKNFKNLKGN